MFYGWMDGWMVGLADGGVGSWLRVRCWVRRRWVVLGGRVRGDEEGGDGDVGM